MLWSNSDQVSESWEVQWKYYWGDAVCSGDVIWIREYNTHHCAFGWKYVFFLTFYIHLQCKGCGVVWRKWFSVFEGFINAIWWQKHQFMFGCIVSADKIEKCIVCAGDWAIDGGGKRYSNLETFVWFVLAFSAGVIGGNTKCSKYFLTRCILIFFGETNWDLCIP